MNDCPLKIYCTLYRKTPNGLKVVGTDVGRVRFINTGIEVTTTYWTSGRKQQRHSLIQGVSTMRNRMGRLNEMGEYRLGGRITIHQAIYFGF